MAVELKQYHPCTEEQQTTGTRPDVLNESHDNTALDLNGDISSESIVEVKQGRKVRNVFSINYHMLLQKYSNVSYLTP